ncbi:FdhD protein [Haloechinothrix alba]|uniref:FdhD protein n=1 Tax=Haloechinothrix alba TaxID=664784 RepID=A0A238XKZ8_9PSEU|nr:formate dehydrogenase accessory sulfurtransferase FdhD [Haloechinothrix alba]SNR59352.1 FdhD protein [Haloechinothrix alba]
MGRTAVRTPVRRITDGASRNRQHTLAAEEPLAVRVAGHTVAVPLRTPGKDVELAHGVLLDEGVIDSRADVRTARYCAGTDDQGRNTYNVLDVALAPHVPPPEPGTNLLVDPGDSCAVTSTAAVDAVRVRARHDLANAPFTARADMLATLPSAVRSRRRTPAAAGALPAAALFDESGAITAVREDIDQHNAVDKLLGWAVMQDRMPVSAYGTGMLITGRATFTLARKAVLAGVPLLATTHDPSSTAVELAEEHGMTLVGSLATNSVDVYTRGDRVPA